MRKAPVKDPYDVVLIVCEGGKTEPNYFGRLCKVCGVTSARVTPADGTDPVRVVKYAISQYDDHDKIYCVFDRNNHPHFDEAIRLAAESDLGRKGKLTTITSVPCFEVWVLLHFAYSTAPFNKAGNDSACDRVLKAVKAYYADYAKGQKGVYDKLSGKIEEALRNSVRLQKYNNATGSTNPATQVHDLVEYLRKVRSTPE